MFMTDFTNGDIKRQEIPSAETLDFNPLSAKYTKALVITGLLFWILPAVALTVISQFKAEMMLLEFVWFWPAYGALVIGSLLLVPVVVHFKGYALRQHDIHYKHGVIWRKCLSLPYNRIQHVEVESGPLERIFELGTVKIFTAGGGRTDMAIAGLPAEEAAKLRDHILVAAAKARNTPLETSAPEAESPNTEAKSEPADD